MSLRQDYRELNQRHRNLVEEAQAARDSGNRELFRQKMDEAKALGPELEEMKSDLMEMDRSAVLYEPSGVSTGASGNPAANQLTRADLADMSAAEISAAHKAGLLDNILKGKE